MKNTASSTIHHTTVPFPAPHAAPHGHAAAPQRANAPAPDAPEIPAGGRARPGGPIVYSERVIQMLCEPIRELGLTDWAAAESIGMSPITLARWKREFPEIGRKLQQAREDFRRQFLEIIMKAAQADNARGWRAATWVLERLFPCDYSPRMQERFAYRSYQDVQRDREDRAILDEDLKELWRAKDEQLDREEEQARQKAAAEAEARASASEGDLHNVHNCRNSGAPEPRQEEASPAPAAFTTFDSDLHNVHNSEAAEPAGHPARPGSFNGAARPQACCTASESDLHNVKNSPQDRGAQRMESRL